MSGTVWESAKVDETNWLNSSLQMNTNWLLHSNTSAAKEVPNFKGMVVDWSSKGLGRDALKAQCRQEVGTVSTMFGRPGA